jgi:phage tail sheath protein FI
MANYVSPGVYTIEKDISEYAPSINTSIVGIVGFAGKGPTNKATLITSQNSLVDTFGEPSEGIYGQGLEGSLEILEQTNSLYFVRAATATAADASATVTIGSCPSLLVSGAATNSTIAQGFGVGTPLTLRVQVYDNAGTAQYTDNDSAGKDFSIPAGTAVSQAEAIRKVVGGGLDADKAGCFFGNGATDSTATGLALSGLVVGSFAGSGASMSVSACSGTTFSEALGASALAAVSSIDGNLHSNYGVQPDIQFASAVRVYGASILEAGSQGAAYLVESLYPGAGYNGGTKTDGTVSGNSITVSNLGSQNFSVNVNDGGTTAEAFKTSFVGSGSFIEDVINTGETNTKSNFIKGNLQKANADATAASLPSFEGLLTTLLGSTNYTVTTQYLTPNQANNTGTGTPTTTSLTSVNGPRFIKLNATTALNLSGGNNGDASGAAANTALIGSKAVDPKTGMQALDDPNINIGIALVPGVHNQSVQNNLITLAESTQDFLALVSPPYAVGTVQNAIDWSNGQSSTTAGSRTSPINSSYAAIYWPWVKVFSVFDGIDRWLDPAIYGARQMAFTDTVADSWFAPAGFRRGRLTKPTEVEVKLNQGDRDSLYSGGNVINPVVSFPQQGITIFGQRTTQRSPSALDRINVRRLMIYIRKVILAATQRFVFEPNDEFTWAQIEGVLNPFLDDIKRRRGITEFRVVCDESVNTPLRIDRNELWTKVLVKPTKTAEILIFEINLTNQSAQLGSL